MARGGAAAAARFERRRKEKEGAGETGWREWPGSLRRRPDQGGLEAGRGASNAGVRPPRGRRRVERGASVRGREEKGEAGRAAR